MPVYAILILTALIGALYLAMTAIARRWPGDGPWFGAGPGKTDREPDETRHVQVEFQVNITRQALLHVLRARFGELPAAVIARIEQGDPEWCKEVFARAVVAGSLEEPGLSDEPDVVLATSNPRLS